MAFHPSLIFIAGALLQIILRKPNYRRAVMLSAPVLAFMLIRFLPQSAGSGFYLGLDLVPVYTDRLCFIFLHVFVIMAFIAALYGLHVNDPIQHAVSQLYVAGALGVCLAGDYMTLFVFWEMMAFSSVFLIWSGRTPASLKAGFRYLLVHAAGGLVLLAGIVFRYMVTDDLTVTLLLPQQAAFFDYLIMTGFMLNAAVPPLHAWLTDAYPEASVTGAVYLCAFTTKTAVYVLARVFAGFEVLAILGAIMALYGVFFAVVENDGRRILAYHIVSQVGYMVCAVGIGTDMAVNGACAHAYAHILYKALLFMGVGSVLAMAGTAKLSDLGGLYRSMPLALVCTVIGGISISGFPLTSGFISKSMVVAAAGEDHRILIMLVLMLASVGTFLSVGIKLPYFIWFGKDVGAQAKDPPGNMILAMAVAAFFCFLLGVWPDSLYRLLPFASNYRPYTLYHLSETLQVVAFTGLGFYLLRRLLVPKAGINLDLDWFYRKGAAAVMRIASGPVSGFNEWLGDLYRTRALRLTYKAADKLFRIDRKGLDGFIDGIARHTLILGELLRRIQTGKIQHYIGGAVVLLFLILIAVVLL